MDPESESEASTLREEASAAFAQRRYKDAAVLFRRSLALYLGEECVPHPFTLPENSPHMGQIAADANDLGITLFVLGQYRECEPFLSFARGVYVHLQDDTNLARATHNLANAYYRLGQTLLASKLYSTALEICSRVQDSSGVAEAHNCLGVVAKDEGRLEEATELLRLALAGFRSEGNHAAIQRVLHNQADLAIAARCFAQAEAHVAEALDLARKHNDKSAEGHALFCQARVFELRGMLDKAEATVREALQLLEGEDDVAGIAVSIQLLGSLRRRRGDMIGAVSNHQRALACRERMGDRHGMEEALQHLGLDHAAHGDHARALEYFLRAEVIARQLNSPHDLGTALLNSGNAYQRLGDSEGAEAYFREAGMVFRASDDDLGMARATCNLLNIFRDTRGAIQTIREYEDILTVALQKADTELEATVRVNLGVALDNTGQYQEAISQYERALRLARRLGDRRIEMISTANIGYATRAQGDNRRALHHFGRAIALLERGRSRLLSSYHERALFGHEVASIYHDAAIAAHAIDRRERAFALADRSKGRALLEAFERRPESTSTGDTAVAEDKGALLAGRITRTSQRLYCLEAFGDPGRESKDERRELYQVLRSAESELALLRSERWHGRSVLATGAVRTEKQLRFIQERLADDAIALAYSVGREEILIWGITRERVKTEQVRIERQRLFNLLDAAYTMLEARPRSVERARTAPAGGRALEDLRSLLLDPFSSELERAARAWIVPDGPLWCVPFEVYFVADGHADVGLGWKEDLRGPAIGYVPSARFLLNVMYGRVGRHPPQPIEGEIFGVGDVLFEYEERSGLQGAVTGSGDQTRPRLDRLRWTREEVYRVFEVFSGRKVEDGADVLSCPGTARILLGTQATKGEIKKDAPRYRILHFATHGLFNSDHPLMSALLCSAPSDPGENYEWLLHAFECMELGLSADLVTLSACETGRAQILPGEGGVGLATAFLGCGVKTVLGSLWKVNDRATALLMGEFYTRVVGGAGLSDALSNAKRVLMRMPEYEDPYFWAPFIIIGDQRPLYSHP